MNKSNPDDTVCVRMLETGHYFIRLMVYVFNDAICDCIENVSDYCSLHSQRMEGPFIPFYFFNLRGVLYDSDENQDISTGIMANDNCVGTSDRELENTE